MPPDLIDVGLNLKAIEGCPSAAMRPQDDVMATFVVSVAA